MVSAIFPSCPIFGGAARTALNACPISTDVAAAMAALVKAPKEAIKIIGQRCKAWEITQRTGPRRLVRYRWGRVNSTGDIRVVAINKSEL